MVYSTVKYTAESSSARLRDAVDSLLRSASPDATAKVLWRLCYISHRPASYQELDIPPERSDMPKVISIPTRPFSIALEDEILDAVRAIWEKVLGAEAQDQTFLRFEEREQDPDAQD